MTNKKLVLEEKDGNVLAGISQKDCDPLFSSFPGTLTDLLMEQAEGVSVLAGFVTVCETRWVADPKAAKYTAPKLAAAKPAASKTKPEGKASSKTPKSAHDETDKVIASEVKEPSSGTPQLPLLDKAEEAPPEVETETLENPVVDTAGRGITQDPTAGSEIDLKTPLGFYLATGEGPFADIQLAMDALGMPKDKRPTHKRYGRLSKELQAKIIDKTK